MVQVKAWCRQATNHCQSQCPRSMSPHGITNPQRVNPWHHHISNEGHHNRSYLIKEYIWDYISLSVYIASMFVLNHCSHNSLMLSRKYLEFIKRTFLKTLRLRQNGHHFPDDIFKCILLNENISISIKISLKFVPKGPINNIPVLVQIMDWRRPGDKPSSESMMVSLPMHINASLGLNELMISHIPMTEYCSKFNHQSTNTNCIQTETQNCQISKPKHFRTLWMIYRFAPSNSKTQWAYITRL